MRTTRRQALRAAAAAPLLLAAPAAALGADPDRERSSLATVLGLEQTAVVAFEAIANGGHVSDSTVGLLRDLLDDDRQHAEAISAALDALGAKPPIPPRRAKVPGLARVRGDSDAATFAIALEERTIGAYRAAVRATADPNLLHTIAGAMGTDGQHLVVLRELAGAVPVPTAFERGTRP